MKAEDLKKLDTDELLELRDMIDEVLTHRRRQIEVQLQRITRKSQTNSSTGEAQGVKFRIAPRYRSKKDPSVTWSGRGVLPKWMRAEMKGTKLSKEDFRIS